MSEAERIQRIQEKEYREAMLRYMGKIEQHLFMQAQALGVIAKELSRSHAGQ